MKEGTRQLVQQFDDHSLVLIGAHAFDCKELSLTLILADSLEEVWKGIVKKWI